MKVGYLCSDFDVPLYGAEGCSVHIRELCSALERGGHDVFHVCAELGTDSPPPSDRVYRIEAEPSGAEDWRLERDLRLLRYNEALVARGTKILRRERPDVLYERYALFGWGGVELARRHGIPLLLEVNTNLRLEQDGYELFVLTGAAEQLEREIFRSASAVIAVSQWLADWILGLGVEGERVHVIPNAVSDLLFRRRASGSGVRRRYGLDGKRVVGFVGSFQPWHDLRGLIAAFSELAGSDPDLRLLLVGDGPDRQALEREVHEVGLGGSSVFTGNVPHDDVPSVLAAMDVAAVPYRSRGDFYFSPLKLFECMAAGRPTLAASIGQIAEIVDHEQTGLLYEPGSRVGLAEGMRRLLYDEELARTVGTAARRRILARHTWSRVADMIVAIAEEHRP